MAKTKLVPGQKLRSVMLPETLIAEATVLAKAYDVSFNRMVVNAVKKAVETWHVPYMERKERPAEDVSNEAVVESEGP